MVPVATVTGVFISAKSNERLRAMELGVSVERRRFEIEKENATAQREAATETVKAINKTLGNVHNLAKE